MDKNLIIAPSTDPCPLADLIEYAKEVLRDGADWIHCDIMDGKFVERKTFDEIVLSLLSKRVNSIIDVHLMIENPIDKLQTYAQAGANIITVHYEALGGTISTINAINKIHELGCKAGLSIKPQTPVSAIENYLPFVDLVLVMSVEPGESGQPFMQESLSKIAELSQLREMNEYEFQIEVDGGINEQTAGAVVSLGADILVVGSAIFNSKNRGSLIRQLKNINN